MVVVHGSPLPSKPVTHARPPRPPARLHVRVLMREWALVGWHFRREGRERVRGERGPAAQAYNALNDVLPLDVVGSISFWCSQVRWARKSCNDWFMSMYWYYLANHVSFLSALYVLLFRRESPPTASSESCPTILACTNLLLLNLLSNAILPITITSPLRHFISSRVVHRMSHPRGTILQHYKWPRGTRSDSRQPG